MGLLDSVVRLQAGLDYHLARANLLTANLTQVDTPNYRPVDLARTGDFQSTLHVAMESTNPAHFGAASGASASKESFQVMPDPGASRGLDGNGVNVDREAAKVAANNVRYEALASLVAGELSGLEWAATDGRGA
jgi:flagellar basal-body rod protein FlgB